MGRFGAPVQQQPPPSLPPVSSAMTTNVPLPPNSASAAAAATSAAGGGGVGAGDNNNYHNMMFQTQQHGATPLHVDPPVIPPHLVRPKSRWSDSKFCNLEVPSYVPPELIILGEGKPLDVFLKRARLADMKRMTHAGVEGLFFMRKKGELPADFNCSPAEKMTQLRTEAQKEFNEAAKRFRDKGFAANAFSASGGVQRDGSILHRIYLTQKQIDSEVFVAVLGVRGATQKALQAETGCRIVIGGRGITDLKKAAALRDFESARRRAEEPPHVEIIAPNEDSLRQCVEKVEFIISPDSEEAERVREFNRRRVHIDNGYRDSTRTVQAGGQSRTVAMSASEIPQEMLERMQRREEHGKRVQQERQQQQQQNRQQEHPDGRKRNLQIMQVNPKKNDEDADVNQFLNSL